ncbi:MAG TPA: 1-(5-phosphoribosyl)-5-[(5-phosphoribosylamino)methylideneamino]imidazole-4-carboxamide isomerase [Gemmatimonadales bacterium]
MLVIPALDLRDGSCVQLVGGSYDDERVRLEDPVAVAREWARLGFQLLHVVDLDAATGRGSNADVIEEIVRDAQLPVQVGGGVRSEERVESLLDLGAARVVVGTRALEDPDWLAEVAALHPGALVVAADVKGRRIVTRGWESATGDDVDDVIAELNRLPLAGVMVTAVHREGQMQGPDLFLMEDVVEASAHPVLASGGVASERDLRELAERGVAATVVGMALYTGAIDPRRIVMEFGV